MANITEVIHGHIATHIFEDDGRFPNNPKLPVLVYKGALHLHPGDSSDAVAELFKKNDWKNSWEGGVLEFDHYHSSTHEVLGIFCGTADIILGGTEGTCVELTRGDVVIIPAGVAHKNLNGSKDFLCIGAYPEGNEYDMKYGKEEERQEAIQNIAAVKTPETDPVFGNEGPLLHYWTR
ncbi:hypothetical protein WG906_03930 [Pedobacter sp. P351]|uniref:hypothetical protein n=1 Tax=Pedobacter superstes TaxID=3133441 RepID=UPI0030AB7CB6